MLKTNLPVAGFGEVSGPGHLVIGLDDLATVALNAAGTAPPAAWVVDPESVDVDVESPQPTAVPAATSPALANASHDVILATMIPPLSNIDKSALQEQAHGHHASRGDPFFPHRSTTSTGPARN
jgi:hypothetical protein